MKVCFKSITISANDDTLCRLFILCPAYIMSLYFAGLGTRSLSSSTLSRDRPWLASLARAASPSECMSQRSIQSLSALPMIATRDARERYGTVVIRIVIIFGIYQLSIMINVDIVKTYQVFSTRWKIHRLALSVDIKIGNI